MRAEPATCMAVGSDKSVSPDPEGLKEALLWLDDNDFPLTSRLPLFAARHWSPRRERTALGHFRAGLCNSEEVAVPRWYWRGLQAALRPLFSSLSLGQDCAGWSAPGELAALLDHHGKPRWRVVSRFSRYVLHSRPEVTDDSLVYLGDDTLFLMRSARDMMARAQTETHGPLRVLDLCCGGGGVGLALPAFWGEMVGIDIHPNAIALARSAALAQGLDNYHYLQGQASLAFDQSYDLIVGNPPTLPPELTPIRTLYASGPSSCLIDLLNVMLPALSPQGRALLTVFSTAQGTGPAAPDELRRALAPVLNRHSRGYAYRVRRQFPLGKQRWLRHVALEIFSSTESSGEQFHDPARGGIQLSALDWRRRY